MGHGASPSRTLQTKCQPSCNVTPGKEEQRSLFEDVTRKAGSPSALGQLFTVPWGRSIPPQWVFFSNGEGVPVLSLGNGELGLWAPSLEGRQMVARLNSAFHFNIGNVFNSPLFVSLKKGKWRKRPAGNLLTKAQAAQKSKTFFFSHVFPTSLQAF